MSGQLILVFSCPCLQRLGPMEDRTCLQCARPLFSQSRDVAFERACCRAPFHKHCIGSAEMERCPSCQKRYAGYTDPPFLWIPVRQPEPPAEVVVIDDSDDGDSEWEPSAKRQKVGQSSSCVICLEQGTFEDQLMTTDCCKQSAHVPCLRRYYELPVACRTKQDRDERVEKLGLPDCFVCRGERGSRPLTWNILTAILPRVDGLLPSSYNANLDMMKFKRMLRRLVDNWLKPWKYMLLLDAGRVAVRFADGSEKSNRLPRTYMVTANKARTTIKEALVRMVPEWAGVPIGDFEFTDRTCREFRLAEVTEIVIVLTLSHYRKEAIRSTRQNARPFELEYLNRKLSTWVCYGHYFDFDIASEPEITARACYHHYVDAHRL